MIPKPKCRTGISCFFSIHRPKLLCVLWALFFLPQVHRTLLAQQHSGSGTISGIITEATTGEAVIGISVLVFPTEDNSTPANPKGAPLRGIRTNKFGFYSIVGNPNGKYLLVIRGVGYKTYQQPFIIEEIAHNLRIDVKLETEETRLQEVAVEAERLANPTKNISAVSVSMDFLSKMPSLGGEKDIFRALQLLPGVKTSSEISSGLYIRGGSPDQNLTLLDGVIVYNPSHLGGFLSTFNGDAIRDVRLIKGAFPAEYGGRLSSVIDLTMKEGSNTKLKGEGNISLIASRLTVEGPLLDNITFMISGRRTYFDLLVGLSTSDVPAEEKPPQYYFYDLNTKINWKISENDRLFLSGYFGRDVLGTNSTQRTQFGLDWGNATGNLRWMHIVSPTVFTNFSAIYSDYNFSTNLSEESVDSSEGASFNTLSQIRDLTLRADVQWFPDKDHTIKSGVEATFHRFGTQVSLEDLQAEAPGTINALEASWYIQDEWQSMLGIEGLSANLGFRLAYFQQGSRLLPEPRLSFVYNLTDNLSLKSAFAVANQFLHLVTRNDISLPSDTWFPSTETIKPGNSIQYVLGAETTIFDKEVLVSAELYYKSMNNLYEFRDDARFSLFAPLESDLTPGRGEAFGAEIFIHKRIGAFTGWLGYTLAWTTRTFDSLNNGQPFYPRYDRRHDIALTLTYKLGERWELGASWVYGTGQAYTMPTARYYWNRNLQYQPTIPGQSTPAHIPITNGQYNYTERNGFRLPPFHKLDLNFIHYFQWFGLPFNISMNIYNAYNRRNPFAWVIEQRSATVPILTQYTLFPIIPTLGLGFKF